jgi:hypothetical protein
VKYKPTLRRRRVEGFGQAAKPDTSQAQFLDGFDQLFHRARQAVELPHNQRVAASREFQRIVQGGSIRNRALQRLFQFYSIAVIYLPPKMDLVILLCKPHSTLHPARAHPYSTPQ